MDWQQLRRQQGVKLLVEMVVQVKLVQVELVQVELVQKEQQQEKKQPLELTFEEKLQRGKKQLLEQAVLALPVQEEQLRVL